LDVLVTGSGGFIGKHTVLALKERGYSVKTFDISSNEDIRDEALVKKKVKGVGGVIHLGAIAEVPYSFEHPSEVADVNITGMINILEACRRCDIKRFVFASSSSVYGEPRTLPVPEDHALNPVTPYGLSKLVGEQYANLYFQMYGIETVSLRYFNVYGIGQTRGLVADSLNAIKKKKPIVIFGDGSQTRDFVNVSDVAQMNVRALQDDVPTGPYNVGTGIEVSILEIVKNLQELSGSNSTEFKPPRTGDIKRIYADIGKSKQVLRFRPTVQLRQGLAQVVRSS
jgi:UDP-glucose 4-epimerase